jgi:hypothetical protein
LASEDCLTIYANHYTAELGKPYVPIYATGKIFGLIANPLDNLPQSKYGTIVFRVPVSGSNYEGYAGVISFSGQNLSTNGVAYNVIGKDRTAGNYASVCFSNASGNWFNTFNLTTNARIYFSSSWPVLSPNVFSNTGETAWTAIAVIVASDDLQSNGVVQGNGFKGFLDTNYFRAIGNATVHQTLDNNNFFVPEANLGLAIGWDPSNNT